MPNKVTFMQIVLAAAENIRNGNITNTVTTIQHLSKIDAMLVTANVADELHATSPIAYNAFLAALARQV